MKLNLVFDDDIILEYYNRGANPLFYISWSHSGFAYPAKDWMDFGTVILGWWLVNAKEIASGSKEANLLFMEGPYRLQIRSVGTDINVTAVGANNQWLVSKRDFYSELIDSTAEVCRKLSQLNVRDTTGLAKGLKELQETLI